MTKLRQIDNEFANDHTQLNAEVTVFLNLDSEIFKNYFEQRLTLIKVIEQLFEIRKSSIFYQEVGKLTDAERKSIIKALENSLMDYNKESYSFKMNLSDQEESAIHSEQILIEQERLLRALNLAYSQFPPKEAETFFRFLEYFAKTNFQGYYYAIFSNYSIPSEFGVLNKLSSRITLLAVDTLFQMLNLQGLNEQESWQKKLAEQQNKLKELLVSEHQGPLMVFDSVFKLIRGETADGIHSKAAKYANVQLNTDPVRDDNLYHNLINWVTNWINLAISSVKTTDLLFSDLFDLVLVYIDRSKDLQNIDLSAGSPMYKLFMMVKQQFPLRQTRLLSLSNALLTAAYPNSPVETNLYLHLSTVDSILFEISDSNLAQINPSLMENKDFKDTFYTSSGGMCAGFKIEAGLEACILWREKGVSEVKIKGNWFLFDNRNETWKNQINYITNNYETITSNYVDTTTLLVKMLADSEDCLNLHLNKLRQFNSIQPGTEDMEVQMLATNALNTLNCIVSERKLSIYSEYASSLVKLVVRLLKSNFSSVMSQFLAAQITNNHLNLVNLLVSLVNYDFEVKYFKLTPPVVELLAVMCRYDIMSVFDFKKVEIKQFFEQIWSKIVREITDYLNYDRNLHEKEHFILISNWLQLALNLLDSVCYTPDRAKLIEQNGREEFLSRISVMLSQINLVEVLQSMFAVEEEAEVLRSSVHRRIDREIRSFQPKFYFEACVCFGLNCLVALAEIVDSALSEEANSPTRMILLNMGSVAFMHNQLAKGFKFDFCTFTTRNETVKVNLLLSLATFLDVHANPTSAYFSASFHSKIKVTGDLEQLVGLKTEKSFSTNYHESHKNSRVCLVLRTISVLLRVNCIHFNANCSLQSSLMLKKNNIFTKNQLTRTKMALSLILAKKQEHSVGAMVNFLNHCIETQDLFILNVLDEDFIENLFYLISKDTNSTWLTSQFAVFIASILNNEIKYVRIVNRIFSTQSKTLEIFLKRTKTAVFSNLKVSLGNSSWNSFSEIEKKNQESTEIANNLSILYNLTQIYCNLFQESKKEDSFKRIELASEFLRSLEDKQSLFYQINVETSGLLGCFDNSNISNDSESNMFRLILADKVCDFAKIDSKRFFYLSLGSSYHYPYDFFISTQEMKNIMISNSQPDFQAYLPEILRFNCRVFVNLFVFKVQQANLVLTELLYSTGEQGFTNSIWDFHGADLARISKKQALSEFYQTKQKTLKLKESVKLTLADIKLRLANTAEVLNKLSKNKISCYSAFNLGVFDLCSVHVLRLKYILQIGLETETHEIREAQASLLVSIALIAVKLLESSEISLKEHIDKVSSCLFPLMSSLVLREENPSKREIEALNTLYSCFYRLTSEHSSPILETYFFHYYISIFSRSSLRNECKMLIDEFSVIKLLQAGLNRDSEENFAIAVIILVNKVLSSLSGAGEVVMQMNTFEVLSNLVSNPEEYVGNFRATQHLTWCWILRVSSNLLLNLLECHSMLLKEGLFTVINFLEERLDRYDWEQQNLNSNLKKRSVAFIEELEDFTELLFVLVKVVDKWIEERPLMFGRLFKALMKVGALFSGGWNYSSFFKPITAFECTIQSIKGETVKQTVNSFGKTEVAC